MRIAELFDLVTQGSTGLAFEAYDGSRVGPLDAPATVEVRSPRAVRYLSQASNDLGLARAYVSGGLEVRGELCEALRRLWEVGDGTVPWRARVAALRTIGPRLLRPAPAPPEEVRPRGRRHSKRRDATAVSHHYDLSNRFYRCLLGPTMAYTCAVYPHAEATLEEAQCEKFDLVCRKLGLRPGMRLLDVGCGWGGMVVHAARRYGVEALGVTLSGEQAEWGRREIEKARLSDRAEIRHLDYRDVPERDFDAISSIGLTEHIGRAQMPAYFTFLRSRLRPRGRLLNHCITRPDNVYPSFEHGGFIDRYVFPDGELSGPGRMISAMTDAGFELRHEENFREHYARTLAAWLGNLEAHWQEAVHEVGEGRARVWRLYLAGSQVSFERRDALELHQVLGVRTEGGDAGMPLRNDWEGTRVARPNAAASDAEPAQAAGASRL